MHSDTFLAEIPLEDDCIMDMGKHQLHYLGNDRLECINCQRKFKFKRNDWGYWRIVGLDSDKNSDNE